VLGLVRLPVLRIGRPQCRGARQEVVDPAQVQLVQVEEVAEVLLDRPGLAVAPGEHGGRQAADLLLDPRGRAAQPLQHGRELLHGRRELELPVRPAQAHGAIIRVPPPPVQSRGWTSGPRSC
jgi:hypothetical protein